MYFCKSLKLYGACLEQSADFEVKIYRLSVKLCAASCENVSSDILGQSAQSDLSLPCPLAILLDTTECMNGERMPVWLFAHAQGELNLHFCAWSKALFSFSMALVWHGMITKHLVVFAVTGSDCELDFVTSHDSTAYNWFLVLTMACRCSSGCMLSGFCTWCVETIWSWQLLWLVWISDCFPVIP